MPEHRIRRKVEELLAAQFCCGSGELGKSGTFCTLHPGPDPHVQILAYGRSVIICASSVLLAAIRRLTAGKTRDEIFEMPWTYGLTIHYVPAQHLLPRSPAVCSLELQSLRGSQVKRLWGLRGFEHAIAFAADGSTGTQFVVTAVKDGCIAAVAGAAPSGVESLWEVGVEVAPEHRRNGLAACLTQTIVADLCCRDIVPFYSASATNIGSQRVAARAGLIPLWVDTFGTVGDVHYAYSGELPDLPGVPPR